MIASQKLAYCSTQLLRWAVHSHHQKVSFNVQLFLGAMAALSAHRLDISLLEQLNIPQTGIYDSPCYSYQLFSSRPFSVKNSAKIHPKYFEIEILDISCLILCKK
jgi:hypothetical protein